VVAGLVSDPSEVPDVRVQIGLPGRSSRGGYWRLYLSLELTDYIEVREEDIVHFESLDDSQTPLRGTAVWIKRGAEISHTSTSTREMQAEFLGGDIAKGFLAGAETAALEASTWTVTTIATTLLCTIVVTATICRTNDCATKSSTSRTSCCLCPTPLR
jgi:hypothetical protein